MSTFLPSGDADRVAWLNNFSTRINLYAQVLDLSPADITSVQNDAAMFSFIVQFNDSIHQYAKVIADIKNQFRSAAQQTSGPVIPALPAMGVPPSVVNSGIFNRTVALANRIRQHAAYTTAIGQDLDMLYPENTIDYNTIAPVLSVHLDAGHPVLRWKKSQADGVIIQVDRRDGNGFVPLVHTVKTSYLDVAALPPNTFSGTWDYKARYFIGDDEVGVFSQIVSVNVIRTA